MRLCNYVISRIYSSTNRIFFVLLIKTGSAQQQGNVRAQREHVSFSMKRVL